MTTIYERELSKFDVSNFDDAAFDVQLPADLVAGKRSNFAAWHFNGDLVHDGENFICYVHRHHALVDTMMAPDFARLISDVREKWGTE